MANQSKVLLSDHLKAIIYNILAGARKNRAVAFSIIAIIGFLLYMRNSRSSSENLRLEEKKKKKGGRGNVDSIFFKRIKHLVSIVIPTWKCVEVLDLTLLTMFLILRTFLSIYLAGVNGRIVKAIIEMDLPLFIRRIAGLGLMSIPASFVNSFLDFLNRRLAINFRRRLTNHFHKSYLKDMIFYQLSNLDSRVSNPDQRLTSDIDKWATSLSMIYSNFSKPILDIVLFSRKLAELVGWGAPFVVSLWYAMSGLFIKIVSPPFGKLTAIQQKLEGGYRESHTDLVHHAEQIAFYRGNAWEKERIDRCFNQLTNHSESIVNKKLFMGVIDSMLVKYGAVLVGYAIVGLPVFGPGSAEYIKKIGTDPSAITRDYVRNSSLLINLAKAIGRLVISYKEIQQLAGYTTLVHQMNEVLSDLESGKYVRTQVTQEKFERPAVAAEVIIDKGTLIETENLIKFDRVPIISPNGDILVKEISFEIHPGMNTLIAGPNGCGKSSLFRILSSLWPLTGGVLHRPHMDKLFYVPQRPYLPPGTLRDQIIYPQTKFMMHKNKVSDTDLARLLKDVQLQYLEDREGGFDSVNDWNDILSGGEKQRIAMARLFYHKPMFAILDECTSAVSLDVEALIYTTAKSLEITLFTVSHRPSLWKFHEYVLRFDGEGGWEFKKL